MELVKDFQDACGGFFCFHCNLGICIIKTEANLPGLGTIVSDEICITNILYQSKAKNRDRVMYDITEGNQFIVVLPDKEVLFKDIHNGL